MRDNGQTEGVASGAGRRLRPWLSTVALLAGLAIPPVPPAQAQSDRSRDAAAIIDLFVYVDQSRSVFQEVDNRRAADDLVTMIRDVLDQPLSKDSARPVLSGDGRLFLYGFGEKNVIDETADSCDDDIRPLMEGGATADERSRIDDALNGYAANDPNLKATNFACLFDHIAGNPAIAESAGANRQAAVLIASDFLHDPFNRRHTDPELIRRELAGLESRSNKAPEQEARIRVLKQIQSYLANGTYVAHSGVCELLQAFKNNTMPDNVAATLAQVVAMKQKAGTVVPQLAFLEIKLGEANFSRPNSDYAKCAIETSGQGLFAGLAAAALGAERFSFEETRNGEFGRIFADYLASLAPRIRPELDNGHFLQLSDTLFELKLIADNRSRRDATVDALEINTGKSFEAIAIDSVRIGGNAKTPLPAINIRKRLPSNRPITVRLRYRHADAPDSSLTSEIIKIQPLNKPALTVALRDGSFIAPAGQPAVVPLRVTNNTQRPVRIKTIRGGTSADTAIDLPRPDGVDAPIAPGTSREIERRIGAGMAIRPALEDGRISLFLQLETEDSQNTFDLTPLPLGKPAETDALVLVNARHQVDGVDDQPSRLVLKLANGNKNPTAIQSVESIRVREQGGVRDFPLPPALQRSIAPDTQTELVVAESDTGMSGLFDALARLRAQGDQGDGQLGIRTRGLAAVAPATRIHHGFLPERNPRVACPSPDSLGSAMNWHIPPTQGARLTLTLSTTFSAYMPPVEQFRINGHETKKLNSRRDWRRNNEDGQTVQVEIPFDDEDGLLKHDSRELSVELFNKHGDAVCGRAIQVPAHMDGDPAEFEVVEKSWRIKKRDGSRYLTFELHHRSTASFQILDRITVVRPGQELEDGDRVEHVFWDGSNASGINFFRPSKPNATDGARELGINIDLYNIAQDDLEKSRLRFFSRRDRVGNPRGLSPELPDPTIRFADPAWNTERAALGFRFDRTNEPYNVNRLLVSANRRPQRSSEFIVLSFDDPLGVIANNNEDQHSVAIPRPHSEAQTRILAADKLFGCFLAVGKDYRGCPQWFELPALPPSTMRLEGGPDAYDAKSQVATVRLFNAGPYPEVATALVFDTATTGVPPLEQPISSDGVIAAGGERTLAVPVESRADRAALLRAVRFDVGVTFAHGSTVAPVPAGADVPQIGLGDVEIDRIDTVAHWFLDRLDVRPIDPPNAIVSLDASRAVGSLDGFQVEYALVNDSSGREVASDRLTIPGDPAGDLRQTLRQRAGFQQSEAVFQEGLTIRASMYSADGHLISRTTTPIDYTKKPSEFQFAIYALSAFTCISAVIVVIFYGARIFSIRRKNQKVARTFAYIASIISVFSIVVFTSSSNWFDNFKSLAKLLDASIGALFTIFPFSISTNISRYRATFAEFLWPKAANRLMTMSHQNFARRLLHFSLIASLVLAAVIFHRLYKDGTFVTRDLCNEQLSIVLSTESCP